MLLSRIGNKRELSKHCQLEVPLEPCSQAQMDRALLNMELNVTNLFLSMVMEVPSKMSINLTFADVSSCDFTEISLLTFPWHPRRLWQKGCT